MKYFKSFFHFTTFPVGGWVAVLSENKAISASKLKLKLSLVEAELGYSCFLNDILRESY